MNIFCVNIGCLEEQNCLPVFACLIGDFQDQDNREYGGVKSRITERTTLVLNRDHNLYGSVGLQRYCILNTGGHHIIESI